MARVRQRGTSAERAVAAALRSIGRFYRCNVRGLPGSPDFANRRGRWAVFVHGCFWHRHRGCRRATVPRSNRAFWEAKFAANRMRDARAIRALRAAEFRVIVVWECETTAPVALAGRLSKALETRRVDVRQSIDH